MNTTFELITGYAVVLVLLVVLALPAVLGAAREWETDRRLREAEYGRDGSARNRVPGTALRSARNAGPRRAGRAGLRRRAGALGERC